MRPCHDQTLISPTEDQSPPPPTVVYLLHVLLLKLFPQCLEPAEAYLLGTKPFWPSASTPLPVSYVPPSASAPGREGSLALGKVLESPQRGERNALGKDYLAHRFPEPCRAQFFFSPSSENNPYLFLLESGLKNFNSFWLPEVSVCKTFFFFVAMAFFIFPPIQRHATPMHTPIHYCTLTPLSWS